MLLCDLDGFKAVNDTHGHQAGDSLLRILSQRLGAAVPPGTLVARLGGDEFGLLVRGDVATSAMAALAQRIDAAVSEPVGIGRRSVTVGISIGVALHPSQARAPDELVRLADADMYRDKRDRRAAGSRQVA